MCKQFTGIISLLALLVPAQLFASVFGTVKAIVHDPQHRPVQGAQVVVQSRTSEFKQTAVTNDEGLAIFMKLPAGAYDVTVTAPGLVADGQQATVMSDSVQELHFALEIAARQETVEVKAEPQVVNPESVTPTTLVSRNEIAETPGTDRSNSMSMITDFVPGATVVHDQLHVRGGHQVTWAIDGVPVPNTNIATNVGPQFNPKDIDYVEVERGSLSSESGDRTYGVFNVVTRTGFERTRQGELVTSFGNYNTTDNQLSFGDHSEKSAYYFSINGNRTDHGLETPTGANQHNQSAGGGAFTSLIFNVTPNDQLRFVGSARTDYFQVPNDPGQQALGIRDREREQDVFTTFSWVHTIGSGILFTLAPTFHFNRAAFEGLGDEADRIVTTDNRASSYLGGTASVRVVKGRHNASVGVYGLAQHDNTFLRLFQSDGVTTAVDVGPATVGVNGELDALWVEDQFKATQWLALNAGVRLTYFSGLVTENVASPRVGAAVEIPRLHWVLRAAYSRYYQPPPLDTVSPDLLTAVDPATGFLPLRGERDEQHEFGLTIPFRGWVFDFNQFRTGAHNFFDHDAIENSNLFFPLTIEGARIVGYEASMHSPKLFKKLNMHLAYSHQTVEGSGAVTGGLTDFSPPADAPFFLDHDQSDTLSTGFTSTLPWRTWLSGNVAFGSGFLNGDGLVAPTHLPAYATLDLAVGRNFGENWSAKLTATNITDKRYFIDLSNTFGGSHVSDPRMVALQVRYKFHY